MTKTDFPYFHVLNLMHRITIRLSFSVLTLLLLYFCLAPAITSAAEPQEMVLVPKATLTVQLERTQLLETKLSQLLELLTPQQKTQLQLAQDLEMSAKKMQELQKLSDSQQAKLLTASESLTKSEILIAETNKNLQASSEEIKKLRKEQNRQRLQNSIWGCAIGYGIGKLIN